MSDRLMCTCGREVPVGTLWKALAALKPLKCGVCGTVLDPQGAEDSQLGDHAKVALIAWHQLVKYGWTSAPAIRNAVQIGNSRVIGGLLSGLVNAGLIQRAHAAPPNVAMLFVDPKPVFKPGPLFVMPKEPS